MTRETDPIYSFFTTQIGRAELEIRDNKTKLKALSKQQTELKRGKSYLVKLRWEYTKGLPSSNKRKVGPS